jgi:hypothetical protein
MTARLRLAIAAILFTAAHLIVPPGARAQEPPATSAGKKPDTSAEHDAWQPQFSVVAGLSQWILFRGGNVAVEYKAAASPSSIRTVKASI